MHGFQWLSSSSLLLYLGDRPDTEEARVDKVKYPRPLNVIEGPLMKVPTYIQIIEISDNEGSTVQLTISNSVL